LVNAAGGTIVDTLTPIGALNGGQLADAAVNVTNQEHPLADLPLWQCHKLIVTPHMSKLGSEAVPPDCDAGVAQWPFAGNFTAPFG